MFLKIKFLSVFEFQIQHMYRWMLKKDDLTSEVYEKK